MIERDELTEELEQVVVDVMLERGLGREQAIEELRWWPNPWLHDATTLKGR